MSTSDQRGLCKLRVVVPCFNEEAGIQAFYQELRRVLGDLNQCDSQIVFVDDGSEDRTLAIINDIARQDPTVVVYSFSRNFGHQAALIAGIDSTDESFDALVMLDSDLQHPPALIAQMLDAWREGYEVVTMVRAETQGETWFKKTTSKIFYRLMKQWTDLKIVSGASDFCLLGRRAIDALQSMPERELFLRGAIAWIGFGRKLISYHAPDRAAGHSKYSLAKMIRLAKQGIFSFSTSPIRLCLRMGSSLILCAMIYLLYAVMMFASDGTVAGWTSLVAVVVFFGGLNLFTLGVLGEYIARTFEEVKGRPRYVFKQAPNQGIFNERSVIQSAAAAKSRTNLFSA